jgi:repressor of nif and glnA expression
MIKYYIYHIKGKKIGCTKNPSSRIKQQNAIKWEILETHTDIDVASQREIELQKQYGYPTDTATYKQSVKKFNLDNVKKAGKASATKSWKENRDRELKKCSKGGKVGGSFSHINSKIYVCPHCKKSGGAVMTRWHFDKCKHKI